jgi:outer membrane usher protein
LPTGGKVEYAGGPPSVVGYDGRAYISGLGAHNVITVIEAGKPCAAEFDFTAAKGAARPTIGPIKCVAAAAAADTPQQ